MHTGRLAQEDQVHKNNAQELEISLIEVSVWPVLRTLGKASDSSTQFRCYQEANSGIGMAARAASFEQPRHTLAQRESADCGPAAAGLHLRMQQPTSTT